MCKPARPRPRRLLAAHSPHRDQARNASAARGLFFLVILTLGLTAVAVGAVSTADAANRCTRYVGTPSGIFLSSSCPGATGYGTISTSQPDSTSSTGLRDGNYLNVTSAACPPTHLFAYYYNPSTGSSPGAETSGCSAGLILGFGSDGFSYSRCKLNRTDGVFTTRQADCNTLWTE